jgi:hypothetical protein
MSLEKAQQVLSKVKEAANDQVPKGVVLAWSKAEGGNLSWAELVDTLEYLVSASTPKVVASKPDKTNKTEQE